MGDCDEEGTASVCAGLYQLVYLSPEALLTNPMWRDMLLCPVYTDNLVALVVDEAHCVKKWSVNSIVSSTHEFNNYFVLSIPP